MPKMRTIEQSAAYIKESDPDTAFTKTAWRRLVVAGSIPSVRVGQKYILDLDRLNYYLQAGTSCQHPASGGIRPVDARR